MPPAISKPPKEKNHRCDLGVKTATSASRKHKRTGSTGSNHWC